MARHFIAFPSGDAVHKDTIERAAKAASTAEVECVTERRLRRIGLTGRSDGEVFN